MSAHASFHVGPFYARVIISRTCFYDPLIMKVSECKVQYCVGVVQHAVLGYPVLYLITSKALCTLCDLANESESCDSTIVHYEPDMFANGIPSLSCMHLCTYRDYSRMRRHFSWC